jgi:GNAT superfamily N-acetyltransferase
MPTDPPELVLREISAADEACLTRFFADNNLPAVVRQFNPFPLSAETARIITCTPHRDRFYGGFLGDKMVAFSMLRGWDEGFSVPSCGILVDRGFQGEGLGARVTAFTIDEARRLACRRVRLTVYASNVSALQLYLSLGFVEHAREPVTVGSDADQKIVMFKEL